MLDKQVRDGCIELFGRCRNMGKVKVFGIFRLPRFHICKFQFDMNPTSPVLERFVYMGGEAHKTYDTRKAFSDANNVHYSVLPATLSRWRYHVSSWAKLRTWWEGLNEIETYKLKVACKPKLKIIDRIVALPDESQRLEFFRRFQACGAI